MKLQRFLPVIGIAIFIYILWNMDLQKVMGIIRSIDPLMLILATLLTIPIVLLKAIKWNILVRSCGISQSLSSSVSGWLVGFSIGMITPGRLGDLSRAYYLRKKTSLGTSLTTVVTDRLIDVIVLFILTILGLSLLLASYTVGSILIPVAILFIALLALLLAFTRKGIVTFLARPIFRRFVPERYKSRLGSLFRDFYRGLGLMGGRKFLVFLSAIICIATWLLSIFQYYMFSLSLGLGITYSFLFMIAPLTILLDALPISFSGLGTRDAVMIYFLSLIGIAAESAVAFSIMIFLMAYILTGLAGMFFWMRNPIRTGAISSTSV